MTWIGRCAAGRQVPRSEHRAEGPCIPGGRRSSLKVPSFSLMLGMATAGAFAARHLQHSGPVPLDSVLRSLALRRRKPTCGTSLVKLASLGYSPPPRSKVSGALALAQRRRGPFRMLQGVPCPSRRRKLSKLDEKAWTHELLLPHRATRRCAEVTVYDLPQHEVNLAPAREGRCILGKLENAADWDGVSLPPPELHLQVFGDASFTGGTSAFGHRRLVDRACQQKQLRHFEFPGKLGWPRRSWPMPRLGSKRTCDAFRNFPCDGSPEVGLPFNCVCFHYHCERPGCSCHDCAEGRRCDACTRVFCLLHEHRPRRRVMFRTFQPTQTFRTLSWAQLKKSFSG